MLRITDTIKVVVRTFVDVIREAIKDIFNQVTVTIAVSDIGCAIVVEIKVIVDIFRVVKEAKTDTEAIVVPLAIETRTTGGYDDARGNRFKTFEHIIVINRQADGFHTTFLISPVQLTRDCIDLVFAQ